MHDLVALFHDVDDMHVPQHAGIVRLPTGCRVEGGLVEHDTQWIIGLRDRHGVEGQQCRIGVVEAERHPACTASPTAICPGARGTRFCPKTAPSPGIVRKVASVRSGSCRLCRAPVC